MIGAVGPIVNAPPDPNRNSLDRLTALVSSAALAPTDAVACIDIVPDPDNSELDRGGISTVLEAGLPADAVGPSVTKSSKPGSSTSGRSGRFGRSGRSGRLPLLSSPGKIPAADPLTPRVIEAERSGSMLIPSKLAVFSGATLERAGVVWTPADPATLNVECTALDDSGTFVLRGTPSELEKTTVLAPNNVKPISVALSGMPMSGAALPSFRVLSADELFGWLDCVKDVVGIPTDGPPRVGSVGDRVTDPLRDDVTGLD